MWGHVPSRNPICGPKRSCIQWSTTWQKGLMTPGRGWNHNTPWINRDRKLMSGSKAPSRRCYCGTIQQVTPPLSCSPNPKNFIHTYMAQGARAPEARLGYNEPPGPTRSAGPKPPGQEVAPFDGKLPIKSCQSMGMTMGSSENNQQLGTVHYIWAMSKEWAVSQAGSFFGTGTMETRVANTRAVPWSFNPSLGEQFIPMLARPTIQHTVQRRPIQAPGPPTYEELCPEDGGHGSRLQPLLSYDQPCPPCHERPRADPVQHWTGPIG